MSLPRSEPGAGGPSIIRPPSKIGRRMSLPRSELGVWGAELHPAPQ